MKTKKIMQAALIAAVYVALCYIFMPISYGPVQLRVSEALTLLPVLCPPAIAGVSVGCLIANMLSGVPADMVFGTLATLAASLLTYKMRNLRFFGTALPASLPPVLVNAVVIGAQLTILYFPVDASARVYLANMAWVGLGQLVSCGVLGTLLVWTIEKNSALKKLLS